MAPTFPSLDDAPLDERRVVVRVDFNVPLTQGSVSDDTRIRAAVPTLEALLARGATVTLLSHLGRPKGPQDDARLAPVAARLEEVLGTSVRYTPTAGPRSSEQQAFVAAAPTGSVTLVENTRFDAGETKNDPELAAVLAEYGEAYVNDAFGAAHRAHASTEGIARLLPSCAGRLMTRELEVLGRLLESPARPFVVVLGGAKVSDKIGVIRNLLGIADRVLIGGAMAFTFAKAAGGRVGASLVEDDRLELAGELVSLARERGVDFRLPDDVVCAPDVAPQALAEVHPLSAVPDGLKGLDIGPASTSAFAAALRDAGTVFWNGPMGVFEVPPFDAGTKGVAQAIAAVDGMTVVGGGDSVAAVNALGLASRIVHISTGGGASLEFLEGRTLPGVAALGRVPWR